MAQNPNIRVGVDTDNAVKNLENLEGAAVGAENKVENLDGDTVRIDAGSAVRSLDDLSKRLDEADDKARKAGSAGGGISTTTTAFKDLTEGVGGPGIGGSAVASLFGFGETAEGLGDILEGFGGKLGLSQDQVGKLTTALGTGIGALGAAGAAITVATVLYQAFNEITGAAERRQEKLNNAIKEQAKNLRDIAKALSEGEKAQAIRDIVEDINPLFADMARLGIDAKDAVLEIMGVGTPFTDQLNYEKLVQEGLNMSLEDYLKLSRDLRLAIESRAGGVARATENEEIANQVLNELNTTSQESIDLENERNEALIDRTNSLLEAIDAERAYERSLDDVQDALAEYNEKIREAKGDTEAIEDATRDAADEVIQLAKDYGELDGAAVGTEEWAQRTTDALGYVADTLAPDSPLRRELLAYKAEIEAIPTLRSTTFSNTYSSPEERRAINQTPMGAVNITVNGALDANATARQIVNLLKDYRRRYGNLDLGF